MNRTSKLKIKMNNIKTLRYTLALSTLYFMYKFLNLRDFTDKLKRFVNYTKTRNCDIDAEKLSQIIVEQINTLNTEIIELAQKNIELERLNIELENENKELRSLLNKYID